MTSQVFLVTNAVIFYVCVCNSISARAVILKISVTRACLCGWNKKWVFRSILVLYMSFSPSVTENMCTLNMHIAKDLWVILACNLLLQNKPISTELFFLLAVCLHSTIFILQFQLTVSVVIISFTVFLSTELKNVNHLQMIKMQVV